VRRMANLMALRFGDRISVEPRNDRGEPIELLA